jgi:hypothetical protein
MAPSGVISGRTTNSQGLPLVGARVRAMKPWIQENQRMLRVVQEVAANDLGEYRLIWLLPGTYYISATFVDFPAGANLVINPDANPDPNVSRSASRPVTARPIGNGIAEDEVYSPIYFPTTPDGLRALPVELQAGSEYRGADIIVSPTRAYHVRGIITNPPAPPATTATVAPGRGGPGGPIPIQPGGGPAGGRGVQVRLAPLTPNGSLYSTNADGTSGVFDFPRVVPGGYTGYLFLNGMTIRTPVDVRSGDVEGVRLTITEGVNIPVTMTFEGTPPPNFPDLTNLRVTLWRDPTLLNAPAMPANAGGTAELQNIAPGDYRVYVAPLLSPLQGNNPIATSAAWQYAYIKSMRLGNDDVLNGGLRFARQPDAGLEVVVAANPALLEGRVLNEQGEAIPSAFVTLLAADASQRIYRTDMYKVTSTDAAGRFRLQGVPPGDYKVFAWGGVERGSWMDPNFMASYESAGQTVKMEEGKMYAVDVPLNTPR